MKADRPRRWLFWLLLAAASSFFAEVISGASLFPFFTSWGLFVIVPLYGMHILVLSGLAFSKGAPRFSTLFYAGMLFGLYEAYITKVLWDPPWAGLVVHVAGIELLSTLTLVLWWHPFMSFILPLLLVELLATSSSSVWVSLPAPLRSWLSNQRIQLGLAIAAGLLQTAAHPQLASALAGVGGLLVLAGLLAWWRRSEGRRWMLSELLPRGRSWWVLLGLLAIFYLVNAFGLRPEALPGIGGQAAIWALYAASGWLLWRSLQRPAEVQVAPRAELPRRRILWLLAVYLLTTLVASFLPPDIKNLIFLAETVFGWVFGISVLVYCLKETLRQ